MSARSRLADLTSRWPVWTPEDPATEATPRYGPLLVVAGGVGLVCGSYSLGRQQRGPADLLYWSGQLLLLSPIVLGVLSRRSSRQQRTFLLVLLSVCQSFLVWAYSPLRFTFPDELQHLRTASDIMVTHHLFTPNTYLPVSPGFPGLEIVTTALANVSGLGLTACGALVAAVSHVLLTLVILGLYQRVLGGGRESALAALVYAANPHASYFNSLFVYAVLALPFLVLTIRAAINPTGRRRALLVLAPMAVVIATHHFSALATSALLVGLGAALAVAGRRSEQGRQARALLATGFAALVLTGLWAAVAAPSTFSYLTAPLAQLTQSFGGRGGADTAPSVVTSPPLWETGISALSVVVTFALLCWGVVLLRTRRADPLPLAFALLSGSYVLVLVVRVVSSDGPELASRSLTYVMLVAAVPAAVALSHLAARGGRGRGLVVALTATLMAGGITIGLPPWWERIPGTFRVDGFEAGQDPAVLHAGTWAAHRLTPHDKVAADLSVGAVLASYARADLSAESSPVFYASTVTGKRDVMRRLSLDYVFIDRRVTTQTPITGVYFSNDVEPVHVRPLPVQLLAPFDEDPAVDRVYDNGQVQAYATSRVWSP
jgi:hypothetical protein